MRTNDEMIRRTRAALAAQGDVEETWTLGGVLFRLNGRACCGVIGDCLMVRVGDGRYHSALREPHVLPMDFTGRPMPGLVYVQPAGIASPEGLEHWVRRAIDAVCGRCYPVVVH